MFVLQFDPYSIKWAPQPETLRSYEKRCFAKADSNIFLTFQIARQTFNRTIGSSNSNLERK